MWGVVIPFGPRSRGAVRWLRADAGYTRAAAVKVLKQVPVAELFGAHGTKVCTVIDIAGELTLATAARLAANRDVRAGEAQTRLWRAWMSPRHPQFAGFHGS